MRAKKEPRVLIDLCSGTGDIAYRHLLTTPSACHVYCIDFSKEMLAVAKNKAAKLPLSPEHQLTYIEANVESLPLPSNEADGVTIAYGLRNVTHPEKCIQEAWRTLKPGGCFAILELTRPKNSLLATGHTVYLRWFLPLLGKLLTSNHEAYQYLSTSIHSFLAPDKVEKLLQESGFVNTRSIPLTGGIATIIMGYKP